MITFHISPIPVVTIALANFFLSWLYYSPVAPWFVLWQKAVGMDPNKKTMTEEEKKAMPRLMIGAVVASFLLSLGLQVLVNALHIESFTTGLLLGAIVWLTFTLTSSLNSQFEGRKPSLLIINNALYLATYALFSGIFAVWK